MAAATFDIVLTIASRQILGCANSERCVGNEEAKEQEIQGMSAPPHVA